MSELTQQLEREILLTSPALPSPKHILPPQVGVKGIPIPFGFGFGEEDNPIRHLDAADLIANLPAECADLLMFDPPWAYEHWSSKRNGGAASHYVCLSTPLIARLVAESFRLLRPNRYALLWVTLPKLSEWFAEAATIEAAGFRYLSGGVWGKSNGLGVGVHLRGDAELILLYAKAYPRPRVHLSNLFLAPRVGHSIKPERVLASLVEWSTPPGGLVVDPFAGESASLPKVCRRLGRAYAGSEIDAHRHHLALTRFSLLEQSYLPFVERSQSHA